MGSDRPGSPRKHALNTATSSPRAQSPPGGAKQDHSNSRLRTRGLKSQGSPKPAWGAGAIWGAGVWPHEGEQRHLVWWWAGFLL